MAKSKKRIAVNTRFLIPGKLEGIGLFTYESLKIITAEHPEIDFYFLFDRKHSDEFVFNKNVHPVVLYPPARHPILWYWWFEVSVSGWLNANKPDLFLSTDAFACLSTNVPQVVVIHDLAHEHFDDHVYGLTHWYYKHFMPRFAKVASRIATVSKYSKNDIIQRYGIKPELIDVVYNGAKEVYKPLDERLKKEVRAKYSTGQDYFVYVGSIHPRKNVKNLLLAFDKFKEESGGNMKLLIAGRKAWDYGDVEKAYDTMKFKADVIFLGHVPPQELGTIVASAFAMVYVSLFEGFGIPIVEAMSCGVPVIAANTSSMPEVVGDAGLLVNPKSVSEIAGAMGKLYNDAELRFSLIAKETGQLKKFSWELTAKKLWDCCEKAMNPHPALSEGEGSKSKGQ